MGYKHDDAPMAKQESMSACPDGCPYGCTGYCRLHDGPCALGHEPEPEESCVWTVAVLALPFALLLWAVLLPSA